MDRYIGLDVHATSCTAAVIDAQGKRLRSYVIETNGQALVASRRARGRGSREGIARAEERRARRVRARRAVPDPTISTRRARRT